MDQIIYGMGGGKMDSGQMLDHYPHIVDLARSQFPAEIPRIAILPTAHHNGTNEKMGRGFMDFTRETFEDLGCFTEEILIGNTPTGQQETRIDDIKDILSNSHAVFVLGGDTSYLLDVVRDRNLVPEFEQAWSSGRVLAGTSAGLIWLTDHCMSDSESFHNDEWSYVMLQGIGILPVAGNVHDNGALPEGLIPQVNRREQFEEQFELLGEIPGLAVDEFVGIEVRNGICEVRSPSPDIGAYILANGSQGVQRRKIDPSHQIDLNDPIALRDFAMGAR